MDLIDRQAAIKALYTEIIKRRLLDDVNDGALDEFDTEDILRKLPSAQPYTDEEIQKMQDIEQAQLDKAYEIGKADAMRWIPCGERLPEDDVEVLVTDDAGGVQWLGVDKMMSYEDGSGRFWLVSQHPSAWIPLPEPYDGGNDK